MLFEQRASGTFHDRRVSVYILCFDWNRFILIYFIFFSFYRVISPKDAPRPKKRFEIGKQHDSCEYLEYLLDTLHEEEKQNNQRSIDNLHANLSIDELMLMILIEKAVEVDAPFTTAVQKLFDIRLLINCKCLYCKHESTHTENLFDLQLSFPIGVNDYSTQSLLNSYFATEQLTNKEQYLCDECNALRDGERQITLQQAPHNFILVLKHFEFNRESGIRQKLLHKVHYDKQISLAAQTKDIDNIRANDRLMYELNVVIVHRGNNMDCGHYYTLARCKTTGEWLELNDEKINHFDGDVNALPANNTPYILFYKLMLEECKGNNDNIAHHDDENPKIPDEENPDIAAVIGHGLQNALRVPRVWKHFDGKSFDELAVQLKM